MLEIKDSRQKCWWYKSTLASNDKINSPTFRMQLYVSFIKTEMWFNDWIQGTIYYMHIFLWRIASWQTLISIKMCVCYWFVCLKISILATCMHILPVNYSHACLLQIAYSTLNIPNNYCEVFGAEIFGAEQKPKNINASMPKLNQLHNKKVDLKWPNCYQNQINWESNSKNYYHHIDGVHV